LYTCMKNRIMEPVEIVLRRGWGGQGRMLKGSESN
jgi:hypothetical protein